MPDLHYWQHGGFGTVRVKEPMVLGHEISGCIEAVGADVAGFAVGDRVAISPSRHCGSCRYCQQGLQNHCLDMRYYGSAMRTPHVQGAFRQQIVCEPGQAFRLADTVSDAEGALAEPLSVALHAVNRAGPLLGRRVLVTGCGPIGALIVVAKEFDLRGAFRFHEEFAVAVDLLNKGLVDVKPLISSTLPYRDAGRAFALAADRTQAMKVLLDFE